jgi:hypothetical protein
MIRLGRLILCLTAFVGASCGKDKDKDNQHRPAESNEQKNGAEPPAASPPSAPPSAPTQKGCIDDGNNHCTELKSGGYADGDGVCVGKLIAACPRDNVAASCETDEDVQYYFTWKPMYESLCKTRRGKLSKN